MRGMIAGGDDPRMMARLAVRAAPGIEPLIALPPGPRPVVRADGGFPPARQGWCAVAMLAVTTAFALLDQNVMGLLIQQIKRDFGLSDTEAGLLLGPAFVLFYAIVGLPLARWVDRAQRTRIVAIGLFVWSLATAACGVATNFLGLFVARFAVGAGEAANGPAAYSILADHFPRDRLPRAIAALQIGSVAGSGLAMLIGAAMIWIVTQASSGDLPLIGGLRPWQLVFIAVGLPGILVSGVMLLLREPPRRGPAGGGDAPRLGAVLAYLAQHCPLYGPMFFGLALGSLDGGGKAWGAALFERSYGWSPARYGLASGLLSLVLMLAGLYLGTRIVEAMLRDGREDAPLRLTLYCRLAALPAALAMPLMPDPYLALLCAGVQFLTVGMCGPSLSAMLQIVTPNRIRGQVTALYLFSYSVIGSGVAPLLTGLVTDRLFTAPGDLRWSILLLHALFLPAALLVTALGLKPYRAEVRRLARIDPQPI